MDFTTYAAKWKRDENNNFAVACYDQNNISELQTALSNGPDQSDCIAWDISDAEWIDAIKTALTELQND
jgi:hypothetical protein